MVRIQHPLTGGVAIFSIPGRYIGFAPEDGFDSCFGGLAEQFDCSEHIPMVCNSHGLHVQVAGFLQQLIDSDRSIQEAVFRVHMEVDKRNETAHRFLACIFIIFPQNQ